MSADLADGENEMTQTNTHIAIFEAGSTSSRPTALSPEIRVGVKSGHSITWYRAHSLTRRKDGSFCVFALDDQRTPTTIKAKDFAGVCAPDSLGIECPDIQAILP